MKIWDPLLANLGEHFSLICIDLPGHGQSPTQGETLRMDFMAQEVLNIINEIDLNEVHIVGHSMGGYVGLELLRQCPDRVASLTLLNSTAKNDNEQKRADRLRAVRVFDLSPKVYIKEAINNLFYGPNIPRIEPEVRRLQEIALSTSTAGAQASLRGMRDRSNFVDLVNSTSTPIQYIAGLHDTTVTYDSIQEQITSENISFVTLENSGHMSFAEEKDKCTAAIINFIQGI
jgi:pimeloyl-ACP methyl ester carboxylesterase